MPANWKSATQSARRQNIHTRAAIGNAGQQGPLHEKAAEDSRTSRSFAKSLPHRIPPGLGVRLSSAAFLAIFNTDRSFSRTAALLPSCATLPRVQIGRAHA